MTADVPYMLDTNILVHQVRDDSTGQYIRTHYNLLARSPKPLVSVVTHGELRSLALQFDWGPVKVDQLSFLLGYFDRYPIESADLFRVYAVIDDFSRRQGITMGKNDPWIAATASITGTTLLTTDLDFGHFPSSLLIHERILLKTQ